MATSYDDKSASTKKRSKRRVKKTGTATDTVKPKSATLAAQDPPIIIKPGGSVDIQFRDTAVEQPRPPSHRKFRVGDGGSRVYAVRIIDLDSTDKPNDFVIDFPNYLIKVFYM